jgi:hypothetical protein
MKLLAHPTNYELPGLNRDFPLDRKSDIPAQAGIQLIEKLLQSRSTYRLCPLRGLFFLLDSRLRGNDGSNGKSGLNIVKIRMAFDCKISY